MGEIVSREEVSKLPRWAQVAFAARCARRVQPLYRGKPEHLQAINRAIKLAEDAAHAAAHAAAAAYAAAGNNVGVHRMIVADFELLRRRAADERWTDQTPVPPEVFGPLWPDGPPAGWPATEQPPETRFRAIQPPATSAAPRNQELFIELEVPADADDETVQGLVNEVLLRTNALHIAHGGSGLTIDEVQVWTPALVPEEVG